MIEAFYDSVEPPRSCGNCRFYEERTCGYICGILEAAWLEEDLDDMEDSEYMQRFGKEKDDCCPDHEFWED